MKVSVSKSGIRGQVSAPPSKSYTIRALMCAALARGESRIINPLSSDDTEAARNVLSKVGVNIRAENGSWVVSGGNLHQPESDLFCGDSAATLRFMIAICSVIPGKCRLTAGASLSRRPVTPLVQALRQLGIKCSSNGDMPPIDVYGETLKDGATTLPGDISSQFVSALMFIAPLAEQGMSIKLTTPLESEPYAEMTAACLEKFGVKVSSYPNRFEIARQTYRPATYKVEGDWSSVSYFLALGAVSGEVEVRNLSPESLQGDKIVIKFLKDMGVSIEVGKNSIIARKSPLKAIQADFTNCIDLLPTMSVLAASAKGVSEFDGIERARLKESNRVSAICDGLGKMGISVKEDRNTLTITGSNPHGATIDSRNDHRIAMAFSVLGAAVGDTVINQAECVSKTFPQFWDILESIGGKLKIDE